MNMRKFQEKKIRAEDSCTSSTNIVPMADRGIQVWEACKDCHGELEGCQREPPTVTITRYSFPTEMRKLCEIALRLREKLDTSARSNRYCLQSARCPTLIF